MRRGLPFHFGASRLGSRLKCLAKKRVTIDFHGVHIHGQIFLVIAFDSVQCPLLSNEVCFPEDEINEEAGGRRANVLL